MSVRFDRIHDHCRGGGRWLDAGNNSCPLTQHNTARGHLHLSWSPLASEDSDRE
jgi:hypothetical protein